MDFRVLAPVQIIKESWQLYFRLMVTVFSRVNKNCLSYQQNSRGKFVIINSVHRHRSARIKTTHVHIRGVPSTILNSQVSKNFSSLYTNMLCQFHPRNSFYIFTSRTNK